MYLRCIVSREVPRVLPPIPSLPLLSVERSVLHGRTTCRSALFTRLNSNDSFGRVNRPRTLDYASSSWQLRFFVLASVENQPVDWAQSAAHTPLRPPAFPFLRRLTTQGHPPPAGGFTRAQQVCHWTFHLGNF